MRKKIAVLPGDGIGPEVIREAIKVCNTIGDKFKHTFIFEEGIVGAASIFKNGDPYPEETHNLCVNSDSVLFGAIGLPEFDNNPSAKVRPEQGLLKMRKKLGLFANIRPTFTFDSLVENIEPSFYNKIILEESLEPLIKEDLATSQDETKKEEDKSALHKNN